MKRIAMLIAAAALAFSLASAQPAGTDARARSLGGAMTAVNDDMNTLFYNPAGLAFLRRSYVNVIADLRMTVRQEGLVDDQAGTDTYYDYDYIESQYRSLMAMDPIRFGPGLVIGGEGWGAALTGDYILRPTGADLSGYDASMTYSVQRSLSGVVGLGLDIGPLALGANLRYVSRSTYTMDAPLGGESGGVSFIGLFSPEDLTTYDPAILAGVGGILTLGALNAGVYVSDILPVVRGTAGAASLLDRTNVGFSWMPSDNKFKAAFPLVLLAGLDVKSIGDPSARTLCMGMEAGLNAGNFLVALGEVGYTQPFGHGKALSALGVDDFSPLDGTVTAGLTGQFWFARISYGVAVPVAMLAYGPGGLDGDAGITMNVTVSASF